MATIEQLEKQKQDLINNLNKIISETAIPINDRAAIIKELSRAIAEIA
jgi:phenylpyruvate tautomerase PptA (4-oxalocrotonate tautomerase family)